MIYSVQITYELFIQFEQHLNYFFLKLAQRKCISCICMVLTITCSKNHVRAFYRIRAGKRVFFSSVRAIWTQLLFFNFSEYYEQYESLTCFLFSSCSKNNFFFNCWHYQKRFFFFDVCNWHVRYKSQCCPCRQASNAPVPTRSSKRQIAEAGNASLTVAARSLPAPFQCWFFRKTALPAPKFKFKSVY